MARYAFSVDAQGNRTEERLYGADGRLKECVWDGEDNGVGGRWRTAMIRFTYDTRALPDETTYWDASGRLEDHDGQCAVVKYDYDSKSYLAQWKCLGPDRQLKNTFGGVAVGKTQYDDSGRLLSFMQINAVGKVVAHREYTYRQRTPVAPPDSGLPPMPW
jgi:hypothetical protein